MSISERTDLDRAPISEVDPEVAEAMGLELQRQQRTLEMIASENFVPQSVLDCQGSVLTNKYAEGLPGKRYYGGCEYVDIAETLAQKRALALFPGAEHVNVQPHSGAQANMAAYFAVLEPGDRILGMSLAHGGPASTVIDCTGPVPRILRSGAIVQDAVAACLRAASLPEPAAAS